MAKRIGQIADTVFPFSELKGKIGTNVKKIIDIGIQMPVGSFINIDGRDFEIGQSGILEFKDTEIKSLKVKHRDGSNSLMYVIIDCVYDDGE